MVSGEQPMRCRLKSRLPEAGGIRRLRLVFAFTLLANYLYVPLLPVHRRSALLLPSADPPLEAAAPLVELTRHDSLDLPASETEGTPCPSNTSRTPSTGRHRPFSPSPSPSRDALGRSLKARPR